MIIPDSCLPWIKLQRSGYSDLKKEFIENMEKEYNLMLPFLPKKCNSILDIGCGIGGIDVLLAKHYGQPELYLLDSNHQSPDIVYGFTDKTAYYNSLIATTDIMKANGIKKYNILNLKTGLEHIKNIDIIISLLSCGYHYSVDEYLAEINRILSDNGILIIDIRENTDGIEKIKMILHDYEIISTYNKSIRICARRGT